MARYGQRPENALKRANEFIDVGKQARALDTLCEVFKNKKWAFNYSESVLEPIMFKYLDLCVELKKSHVAKEGLFQYRNMFQSVNVKSLENVIRGYLRTAEERTEAARNQSQQAVVDIDDLDNLATPESILLSAVSGEDAQDRSDRTILTPWVKFLWESYCQCLELLRINAHVETLYHDIARMAFAFCLKYNRKTEFRKLCDKLRKHLDDINKLAPQATNVSLTKPETQQFNLETRLVQLESAIQMELWQEAYKATEDIHSLMNMSKKPPIPKTMANYYQKLAMVFWKAGYYLFHAAALFKLFQLSKDMKKNITHDELQRMACKVLLATLSIPLPSAHPEFDRFIDTDKSPMEKAQRLAMLLTLNQPPTRASLLKDILRVNVVGLASPALQELYHCLEVELNPLTLCKRVHAVTTQLQQQPNSTDHQYVQPLHDVTLVRLVRQVSQVYQTIRFDRLLELAHFTSPFHLERLLVECVRHNDMQIRIDHGRGCVHFGMDLAEAQREDRGPGEGGPTLQPMPSEQVRQQLINMCTVLTKATNIINPNANKAEREKTMQLMVKHYHETKVKEHMRILARHKIIEDRKEFLERMNTVREEEEARKAGELARKQALAEARRLEAEREERERKRHESEMQQIKDRTLKEKMQQISMTPHGQKVLKKLEEDELKNLDAETISAREQEELMKERKEMQQKLKSQEKKVDYFERAKRIEEIPLLQKMFEEKQVEDRAYWEQKETDRIAELVAERKLAVEYKERCARMAADKQAYQAKLSSERNSAYQDKLLAFEARLKEEREKRLVQRRAERKEQRRREWREEKERQEQAKREEEQRKKEEEEQRKKDEEERKRREEEEERLAAKRQEEEAIAAAKRAEEEERYQKQKEAADRQAEIARRREAEIEAKRQQEAERERERMRGSGGGGGVTRGGGGGETEKGSWRKPASQSADSAKPSGASAEPWKPSFRNKDERGGGGGGSGRGGDDGGRPWQRGGDRERDGDRPAPRDFDRDRDRDRDGGGRNWDRGGPRRGGGAPGDRDRGFGDRDRDRDRGFGDRDRDRGGDRDRDRGERPEVNFNWRARQDDRRGDDSRRGDDRRRDDRDRDDRRRDDRDEPRRFESKAGGGGGGGKMSWRQEAAPPSGGPPAPAAAPAPAPAPAAPSASAPASGEDGGDDGNWQQVKNRKN
ncbi:eukaryotic translation initiation factor 3 subunit A [Nilaparvata lugens]|uniref:eukaryotic translation initiation factor 3 subunit A n=1 Tax=Nilaparvata lugens TaxID=108931 RepID=UPI00193CC2FD|nr:eukaryotic translation initiation factor 3 subunit A [Nilaparvata lugens]